MSVTPQLNAIPDFDFEVWATLAREDPEEFERRRRAAIDALIASRPANRQRLEGTQFRIDMERKLARTPLKACLRLSEMMWETFLDLRTELAELSAYTVVPPKPHLELVRSGELHPADSTRTEGAGVAVAPPAPLATVLTFAPRDADRNDQ
jgi:hypothetical protein